VEHEERPQQLTAAQVADELGCSIEDVRRLIRDGELPTLACGIRPGLVPRREVEAYTRRVGAGRAPGHDPAA
jgi:excisionase family DNA binding protein